MGGGMFECARCLQGQTTRASRDSVEREPGNEIETVTLSQAASYLLDECRMVLPGIQALFGFQLIAIFNQRFADALPVLEQRLHFASLTLVALSIAIIMSPAAYHRMQGVREVS